MSKEGMHSSAEAHNVAVENLKERARKLIERFEKAKASIDRIHALGWKDKWFTDLKQEVIKVEEHMISLKGFMDRAKEYQGKLERIIDEARQIGPEKYNN